MTNQPQTLIEAIRYFSDPDVCLDFMSRLRWPDGKVTCPNCGRQDVVFVSSRRLWQCRSKHAKRQFSVKVGTIFEDSPIPLDKWLATMWLITNAKNGVSSYEIHRAIGVTQKTAWFMLHRIRLAMQSDDFDKLDGQVEADETFVGGKARFMHKDKRLAKPKANLMGKTTVLGLLERVGPDGHSRVRAKVVRNNRRTNLSPEVRQQVKRGAEVHTDALKSYNDLDTDYIHQVVDHSEEYVRGHIHTNGLENFWALMKRAIHGTYVTVSPWQLQRYVEEEVFRYNNRKTGDGGRFQMAAGGIVGKRLTYRQLTRFDA